MYITADMFFAGQMAQNLHLLRKLLDQLPEGSVEVTLYTRDERSYKIDLRAGQRHLCEILLCLVRGRERFVLDDADRDVLAVFYDDAWKSREELMFLFHSSTVEVKVDWKVKTVLDSCNSVAVLELNEHSRNALSTVIQALDQGLLRLVTYSSSPG